MKPEILKAIKLAEEIAEKKGKLVVGTDRSRVPQDSEGNPTAAPIMIHFDAGKNIVFFRTSDEEGEPWGFEVALPVAEALGLALNDLLGLFDGVEAEEIAQLKKEISELTKAADYWAAENAANSNDLDRLKAEKKILLEKIEEEDRRLAELENFAASVSGLWATDRPDLIGRVNVGEDVLFKIEPPEASK
jgi:hypothetical protein